MTKYFLFMLVISIASQNARGMHGDIEMLIAQMEPQCASSGGMCMKRADCPPDSVSHSGYCPRQKRFGVICCETLPISERRCEKRGGICTTSCPDNLIIREVTDCLCCPLVY